MARGRTYILGIIVLVTLTTGCSAATARRAAEAPGSTRAEPDFGHIHGVDLNPADGSVFAATHHGVYCLDPSGPVRVAERAHDVMGFTVIGPDRFLGSGHPGNHESGPPDLGLIASSDGAQTWTSVGLGGQADFHALSAAGATVYGFDSVTGSVMRSDDSGQHWQRGTRLAVTDLDVDPNDPLRVLATTPEGLQVSGDGGMAFRLIQPQPSRALVLVDHVFYTAGIDREPSAAGLDADGGVWALEAAGWRRSGTLADGPTAFTVVGPDRYLAATGQDVVVSEDAGRSWTSLT